MSQVIIVSNRLPITVKKEGGRLRWQSSLGGLATGLSSYVGRRRNIWIGWPGIASEDLNDHEKQLVTDRLARRNCRPVWLTRRQIEDFYNGYSNSVLWPVFHTLRRKTKTGRERQRWWRAYREVNQKFAEAALTLSEDDSRIWVHDYQLMLVTEFIRAERPDITTGFFLHIPFPSNKTFASLAEHKRLLKGMLAADLVGFHTPDYVTNFLDAIQTDGLGEIDHGQVVFAGRVIRVNYFPMGIDYAKYASASKDKAVKQAMQRYAKRYKGRKLVVAVDRLDPSKGLAERLEAYQLFLQKHPALKGEVVFCMVAAPSRTEIPAYQNLSIRLKRLSAQINRQYGDKSWQPVDYLPVSMPFEEVAALFRLADVAFIAPLKDGMNLVAKEFVASARKNGTLILSETAGASRELSDAILVNPRQPEQLAEALYQALTMRRREMRRRLKRMRSQLASYTVNEWAKDFIAMLNQPVPGTPTRTRNLRGRLQAKLIQDYKQARRRLILLDYDGSLMPFSDDFAAMAPPASLISTLEYLSDDPANDVVMVSGRTASDLDKWFGKLPVSLIAEHGAMSRRVGQKRWQTIEKTDTKWKELIIPILQKYTELTPRARIEVKPHTLVWHYRASPPYQAQKYAVTIKRRLKGLLRQNGLQLMQGNKVLEIKNPRIGKGRAASDWLAHDYDFIMSLGDDRTDEELFAVLPDEAYSIKVGRGRSRGRYRLPSHREVRSLLKRLAKPV